jgi:hypothetical protein
MQMKIRGAKYLILGILILTSIYFVVAFTVSQGAECGIVTESEQALIYSVNGGDDCTPVTTSYPYHSGICSGSLGCFGITDRTSCDMWSECSWDSMCCKTAGRPEDCPDGTTFDPICSGTYTKQVIGHRCEGTYQICDGSGGFYDMALSFYGLITGNVIREEDCITEDLSEEVYCYGSTELACESLHPACYWDSYIYTTSGDCSKLSDSSCDSYEGCLLRGDCVEGCKEESDCGLTGICSSSMASDCAGTFIVDPPRCESTGMNNGLVDCSYFQDSTGCKYGTPEACESQNCDSGTVALQSSVCPWLSQTECLYVIPFCGWYVEGDCNRYDDDPVLCINRGCNYLSGSVGTCESNGCYNVNDCGENEVCTGGIDGYCSGTVSQTSGSCVPKSGASDSYKCSDYYAGFTIYDVTTDFCTFAYMLQDWLPQVCKDSKCTDTTIRTMDLDAYCSNFEQYSFSDPSYGTSCGNSTIEERCEWSVVPVGECTDYDTNPAGCEAIGCIYTPGIAGTCEVVESVCVPIGEEICGNGIDEDCTGEDLICPSKKNNCELCIQNLDCKSDSCVKSLDSLNKYCVASGNCAIDSTDSCEIGQGTSKCSIDDVATCGPNSLWSLTEICADGCSSGTCTILPEEVRWKDYADSQVIETYTFIRDLQNQVIASVKYPKEEASVIKIYESDSGINEDGEDDYITELHLVMNDGVLMAIWYMDKVYLDIAGEELDNVFEFYYEYAGEIAMIEVKKDTIMILCENGKEDDDELGVDCGGICSDVNCCGFSPNDDGIKICDIKAGENSDTCPSDCPLSKEALWGVASPVELTIDELRDKEDFPMQLFNYDPSGSLEFVVEEDDSNKEVKRTQGTDVESVLVSTLQISLDDLTNVKKGSDDTDFTLFFDSQKAKSLDLEVLVPEGVPECGNGECELGELNMVCGDTDCFTDAVTCEDYNESEELCTNDPNGLSEDIPGDCIYTEEGRCRSGLAVTVDGVDIGTCIYLEEDSVDNCDDGFLSYSWKAAWNWSINNKYDKNDVCSKKGFFCNPDELYAHYDPRDSKQECQDGQATIPCPAQVQLSFFNAINLIVSALVVFIIYYYIHKKKK